MEPTILNLLNLFRHGHPIYIGVYANASHAVLPSHCSDCTLLVLNASKSRDGHPRLRSECGLVASMGAPSSRRGRSRWLRLARSACARRNGPIQMVIVLGTFLLPRLRPGHCLISIDGGTDRPRVIVMYRMNVC